MQKVSINILKPKINYKKLSEQFTVVQFTTSENYIPFGAQFIDGFSQKMMAKSVVFESGRSLFTLFPKAEFKEIDLRQQLNAIEDAECLSFTVLKPNEIDEVPNHLIVQLLMNAISVPSHHRLRFNNLTGKLFLFNESLFERKKFKEDTLIFKIPAIELQVTRELRLEIRTTTFTSLLLKSKLDFSKRPLTKHPKYTYSYATKAMRRIMPDEQIEAKDVFIIKQEPNKKANIPFLDFSDLDSFLECKMGFLAETFENFQDKLNGIIEFNFEERAIDNVHRKSDSLQQDINSAIKQRSFKVHIMNSVGETGAHYLETLVEQLKQLLPDSQITLSDKHKKDVLNIRLVHNRNYYENNKTKDVYDASLSKTQHLTVEDFKHNNSSAVKAMLKELFIKNDIANKQVSTADWSHYNYKGDYIFGIKNAEQFLFLSISPTGKMTFKIEEQTLFNQSEFDDLIYIFDGVDTVEGIVKNDTGDINIISRTGLFSVPDFQETYRRLKAENKDDIFNKTDILKWLGEINISDEQHQICTSSIYNWPKFEIKKSELLQLIGHRTVKKKLAEHIFTETGILIKTYLRDKTKYELFDSNLDIHSYSENGKLYYFVGSISDGMRKKITRASVIREISSFNGGKLFFNELLPLLNVDFVRYGDLTVVPFPFKYLREWSNTL